MCILEILQFTAEIKKVTKADVGTGISVDIWSDQILSKMSGLDDNLTVLGPGVNIKSQKGICTEILNYVIQIT